MPLRKKCPYSEFFWSAFPAFRLHTEISPYSVQMREIRTRKIPNTDTFYVVFISTEEDHSSYSRNGTRNFSFTFKGNHYSENYFKVSLAYCTYYFSRKLWNRSLIISTWWLSGSLSNIVIRPSKKTRITTKWKFEFIFLSKSFSFFWFNPFSTNFPIMVKPGSWFLIAKCLKNTFKRVTF